MHQSAIGERTIRRRVLGVLVGIAILGLILFAWSDRAGADTFPDNHHDGLADSSVHTYCYDSFAGDESVASYAMQNALDATTDMSDSKHSTCYTSTDVHWQDLNLPGSLRGEYQCQTYYGDDCDSSDVRLDFAKLDEGSNDWYDRRKTSVHEIGHSVGTNHDTISAMVTGEVPSTALAWRRYSSHDISHINANY